MHILIAQFIGDTLVKHWVNITSMNYATKIDKLLLTTNSWISFNSWIKTCVH